jgi:hypothetical protein
MINWEENNQELYGTSSAQDWEETIEDVAEMLTKAIDGCITDRFTILYVEMWPSSGRFICYPATHPTAGALAERTSEHLIQLELSFWEDAWHDVPLNANDAIDRYENLKHCALGVLSEGYSLYYASHPQKPRVTIYTFEFEGTEGVTVIS